MIDITNPRLEDFARAGGLSPPEAADEITRLKAENERLLEVLKAGAVCMSPTERVRWIDRAEAIAKAQPPVSHD